jgi:predicted phosphodiesterase
MKKYVLIISLWLFTWVFAQETTRFMAVGDPHINSPSQNFKQTILYEIVMEAIDEKVDFIFFPGDLVIRGFGEFAEKDSVLKDWRFVLDTLGTHDIHVFACRGNNDQNKEAWDSLFVGKYAFPQNGPENEKNITYALEYNNILFIAMDQFTVTHRINQTWLDSVLVINKKPHVFVAGHEPAFKYLHSNCMGAYPDERNTFWESLIDSGVKIFFCAHDHFYDHAVINDGDENPQNDIHQVIVGTASTLHQNASFDGDNGRWTPDSIFHEQSNGYVLVEVDDDDVQFTWKHRVAPFVFEFGGDSSQFLATALEDPQILATFELYQNYPNPFNPVTMITYQLPITSEVDLSIYNILGEKVATLIYGMKPAGNHQVEWDATGHASGVYIYRLSAESIARSVVQARKLVLLR